MLRYLLYLFHLIKPQKLFLKTNTGFSQFLFLKIIFSVHICGHGANRRIQQKYIYKLKKVQLRNHNTCFFHVFAQTTHVVAAPDGFACVGIPATWLYIPSFIEIRSGVSEPRGSKFRLSHYFGYWLLQQLVLPYKP